MLVGKGIEKLHTAMALERCCSLITEKLLEIERKHTLVSYEHDPRRHQTLQL